MPPPSRQSTGLPTRAVRRKPGRLRKRSWTLFSLAAVVACSATAQMTPDAPVINFRLPMFNDAGYLTWDLRGKEGVYVNTNRVDVLGLRLLVFDDEQPNRVETEIISPQATLLIQENQVRGDKTITVVGDNFLVQGERWRWHGDDNRVVIDENVKVTFFEELNGILQ